MKQSLAAAIVVLTIAIGSLAQPDKDLVGTWKMDASRSRFVSSSGAPALVVITYERMGELLREVLSVTNAGGVTTRTINYALDGRELQNGSGDDQVMSKIVSKDGVVTLQWSDDGGVFARTITLSADRRTMTISAHDSNPDTRADDVIVFQRQ
jgi:hypothetical protein